MQFKPYTSTRTFCSPLMVDECLRRLYQETSIDSAVLPIWGWKPLALNKYIMRKVKGQRFEMYKTMGTPYGSAPWIVQGELQQDGEQTQISCRYGLSSAITMMVAMFSVAVVFFVGYMIFRIVSIQTSIMALVAFSIVAVGLVGLVGLFVALPARAHGQLETEYYTAVQQLFDAKEIGVDPV